MSKTHWLKWHFKKIARFFHTKILKREVMFFISANLLVAR